PPCWAEATPGAAAKTRANARSARAAVRGETRENIIERTPLLPGLRCRSGCAWHGIGPVVFSDEIVRDVDRLGNVGNGAALIGPALVENENDVALRGVGLEELAELRADRPEDLLAFLLDLSLKILALALILPLQIGELLVHR